MVMPIRQLNIFYASSKGGTISEENNKKRSYTVKIDNTIFIVETEESEAAHETAEQKIKKLIEAGIDCLIDEERRRLNNQKATFEG